MWASLKRFDLNNKVLEGVHQTTTLGGIFAVLTSLVVVLMVVYETKQFLRVNVTSRLTIDHPFMGLQPSSGADHNAVFVKLRVAFPHLNCDQISFSHEVTRGTVRITDVLSEFEKENQRFDDKGHKATAATPSSETTNGCLVSGMTLTERIGGNLRLGVTVPSTDNILAPPNLNISHIIHEFSFVPMAGQLPSGRRKVLQDAEDEYIHHVHRHRYHDGNVLTVAPPGSARNHMTLLLVPTQHKTLYGDVSHYFQHVLQHRKTSVSLDELRYLDGVRVPDNFFGIAFSYDFYPVTVLFEERRQRIVDFLANLCGIVGGVVAMGSILERFLSFSAKKLLGKKD